MSQTSDVKHFVTLEPSSIIEFEYGNNISNLKVINSSPTKNIAFKIRTTQPLCYVVKPNSGIIEAKKFAMVDINFVPNDVSSQ